MKIINKYKNVMLLIIGFACGLMFYGPIIRGCHSAASFGVVDLSGRPPQRLTEAMPLRPETEGQAPGLLPAGTVLYPQYGYSEGFTTYIVYVNVGSDSLKSETAKFEHPDATAPIWIEDHETNDK